MPYNGIFSGLLEMFSFGALSNKTKKENVFTMI